MTTSHPTPSSQTSAAAEPPAADAAPEPKQTVPDACDTADALGSHQSKERKLEILADSRTGAFALMAAVAVVGAWLQGADPYWAGALYNLCTVVLLAALCGFAALGLVWRTVKRMSERLHFEARGKFQLEASRALFRRSGVLVGIVIAAEVVMYMLRLWAAR